MRKIKAGFVGFGEINTPREIIERKCQEARKQIEEQGIELIWTNPVSDDPKGEDIKRAKAELIKEDFDFLIVCIAGWIPSHAVIGVVDSFAHKPMLLWGLTGWNQGNRFITTADQAGTTALRKPMQDLGYRFKYVINYRGAKSNMDKIVSFAKACRAASLLRSARIGMMGFRDMNLYGTLYDGVSLRAKVGPEVEIFDMLEVTQLMKKTNKKDIADLVKRIKQRWIFTKPTSDQTIEKPVMLYLGIKEKVKERDYQAVSLIDIDGVRRLMGFLPASVFMLLHEEDNVCTIPENDTMGAVTQLITRYLTDQIAAYMEFYEFMENGVLMGVPDYVPSEIVDGPVTVMPNAFGEFGEGLLNVSRVKTGEVTLSRLAYTGDNYFMHIVKGNAVTPKKWEEAGWQPPAPQLPSLEIILDSPIQDFTQKVMGQHYILSYGDNREVLADLCELLNIQVI